MCLENLKDNLFLKTRATITNFEDLKQLKPGNYNVKLTTDDPFFSAITIRNYLLLTKFSPTGGDTWIFATTFNLQGFCAFYNANGNGSSYPFKKIY